MRRALLLLALVAVFAGGGLLAYELRQSTDSSEVVLATRNNSGSRALANTATAAPDVKTVADVDQMLGRIEATARSSGRVSTHDIELGHAAILALSSTLGPDATLAKGRLFDESMRRLQRELEMKPTQDELARLATEISAKTDPLARERLVAQYRSAAQELPAAYRAEAMARLAVIAPGRR